MYVGNLARVNHNALQQCIQVNQTEQKKQQQDIDCA